MDTHMFIWNASWGSRQPEHLHVTNGVNKPQNKASFFFSCTIYITKRLTKKLTVQLRMWGDSSHAAMSIHFHLIWFPQMALQMHTVLLTTFKFATISNTTAAASNTIPSPSSLCSFINQSSAAATSEEQQQQQQLKIATAVTSQEQQQQQHHRSSITASPDQILINSCHANIQDCMENTPTATTLQNGNPPYMETIAGCKSETNLPL